MAESLSLQEKPLSDSPSQEEPNAPTDENTQSCSVSTEPAMVVTQAGADLLQRLARQVEYYFSTTNLAKDTYVSTLRSLNDGYVPISIISNFGKVRSLVPYDALNAVHQASKEYSDLLEVVFINAETGKRIVPSDTENSSLKLVEAVGPISGEPIPTSEIASAFTVTLPTSYAVPSTAVQNTVVLREVPQGIEEAQVRKLFSFDTCPAIQSLHRDVANCWFVTLDTSSRDVVVDVMLELRKKKFESGEPVMARLKSGVVVNRDAASSVAYYGGNQMMAQQTGSNRYTTGRKNKKKKNSNKSRSNRSNSTQSKNAKEKKNNGSRQNNGGKQKKGNGQEQQQKQESKSNQNRNASSHRSPPRFGDEQFPALPSDDHLDISEKFEVEKVPEHDELGKKNSGTSDSSSTATSSTSSSKSPQPHIVMGGYAAALLKAAAPNLQQKVQKTNQERTKNTDKKLFMAQAEQTAHRSAPVEVNVHPPSWGRGSFADILRSNETAMTTAQ